MTQSEITQLSTSDLKERIGQDKNALTRLTLTHAVSPVENPLKIRSARRTIARLQTELRKRELTEKNN